MNKKLLTLLTLNSVLFAQTIHLDTVEIEAKINTLSIQNLSQKEIKSADLADALSKNVPSITMIRRSGIANDIILRGQKRDNINVLYDGAKIHGACLNRMDPPTSHILTNNIDNVEVNEGPFDVENFGTLSGLVNVTSKKPTQKFSGEVNLNAGNFGYKKFSTTASGGNEKIRLLISASAEEGKQYKDGNGDTLSGQLDKSPAPTGNKYKNNNKSLDAFEKKMFHAKTFIHLADNQELKLSYTGNRSDNVLYPSTKMDAIYDDSDIFNLNYQIHNIAKYSKTLDVQYYRSKVDHPMSIQYRNSSGLNATNSLTNHLTSQMDEFKLKNSFNIHDTNIAIGLNDSKRNWDGKYLAIGTRAGIDGRVSLDDVDTKNRAVFIKTTKSIDNIDLNMGLRYDTTSINSAHAELDNNYNELSGNIFATLHATDTTKYFIGIGRSSRVPDARELNFRTSTNIMAGTPDLKSTINHEIDLGVEQEFENATLKTKVFYSSLKDYIYYNSNKTTNRFVNIDAKIYGLEASSSYALSDTLFLDASLSYQKGKKKNPLAGQTNKNLADIVPLKANISATYEYDASTFINLSAIAVDTWTDIDSDNGEQTLPGYLTFDAKINKDIMRNITLTVGMNNILDKTYAVSNTYKDLTLVDDGAGNDIMLLNEPGRYAYVNLAYRF